VVLSYHCAAGNHDYDSDQCECPCHRGVRPWWWTNGTSFWCWRLR